MTAAIGFDRARVDLHKAEIYAALRITPPGAGISIGNLLDPHVARAIIEVINEPTLLGVIEATDNGSTIALLRKIDQIRSMSRESYVDLSSRGHIITRETLQQLDLLNGCALPPHPFRGGVPTDYNGPSEES